MLMPKTKAPKPKSIDDRALDMKASVIDHLNAIAAIMNEAAKDGIEISFSVNRNEKGEFAPVNVSLLRRY